MMLEMLESRAFVAFGQTMTFQDIRGKHPADVYTHPLQDAEGQEREYAYATVHRILRARRFFLHLSSICLATATQSLVTAGPPISTRVDPPAEQAIFVEAPVGT
jgi:hypothetical protein